MEVVQIAEKGILHKIVQLVLQFDITIIFGLYTTI